MAGLGRAVPRGCRPTKRTESNRVFVQWPLFELPFTEALYRIFTKYSVNKFGFLNEVGTLVDLGLAEGWQIQLQICRFILGEWKAVRTEFISTAVIGLAVAAAVAVKHRRALIKLSFSTSVTSPLAGVATPKILTRSSLSSFQSSPVQGF